MCNRRTSGHPPYDPRPTDACMHDGDHIAQFTLKGGVEICAALDSSQTIGVRQLGKDADVAVVFELDA
jgi:hypothetical protein